MREQSESTDSTHTVQGNEEDRTPLTPFEHYTQAGAMLKAVESEFFKLRDGNLDSYDVVEWIDSMTHAAAVHAKLATYKREN